MDPGRRAISPDTGPRRLAICLALIAGYVDAYALFACSVFVSFMSGNTTSTGSALGQGHFALAVPTGLAILFFVVGSFLGTFLTQSTLHHRRRALFGTIAALLAVIIAGTRPATPVLPPNLSISILALAMGLVNTAQSRVGAEPVSLTFVTGALNKIGAHLALALRRAPLPNAQGKADTHLRRAGVEASIWAGFAVGAVAAGAASLHFGVWALLPPCLALLGLAAHSKSA